MFKQLFTPSKEKLEKKTEKQKEKIINKMINKVAIRCLFKINWASKKGRNDTTVSVADISRKYDYDLQQEAWKRYLIFLREEGYIASYENGIVSISWEE